MTTTSSTRPAGASAAYRDHVSALTESSPSIALTVPVELLRRAERALGGESNDAEHDALVDLVDELVVAAGAAPADSWAIALQLAMPVTPVLRTQVTSVNVTGDARVTIGDDGQRVLVELHEGPLGVAQEAARQFVAFCGALGVNADVESIAARRDDEPPG